LGAQVEVVATYDCAPVCDSHRGTNAPTAQRLSSPDGMPSTGTTQSRMPLGRNVPRGQSPSAPDLSSLHESTATIAPMRATPSIARIIDDE
jgi:hypothetical protein